MWYIFIGLNKLSTLPHLPPLLFLHLETHKKIIPPDFSKHLSATDAPEGTQVVFECHVTGIPSPTISWYKDDASIDSSPEYVITQINGTCCLKIRKVTPEYSGRYMCKANNPGGESSSSAQLNVICKHHDLDRQKDKRTDC